MPEIDDLVTSIREGFFARSPGVGEFSDTLIKSCISYVCLLYSKYRPRKGRRADVDIVVDQYTIPLPSDFMMTSIEELIYLMTGNRISTSTNSYGGIYRTRANFLSIFDSVLGATTDPPPYLYLYNSYATTEGIIGSTVTGNYINRIILTTSDTGDYEISLSTPTTETVTRTLVYDALHIVDATKNTIPKSDREIFTDLVTAQILTVLAQDLLTKPQIVGTKDYSVADKYLKLAEYYQKSINQLTIYGFVG